MKMIYTLYLLALLGTGSAQTRPFDFSAPFWQGNQDLALRMFATLRAQEDGNVFFSPLSLSAALGMTYAGARGDTAAEMARTLGFGMGQDGTHTAFGNLMETLKDDLHLANALVLLQEGVRPEFQALLREKYRADIFPGDLEAINAWVKDQTRGRIPTILEELDDDTLCVLLNAIYFRADWTVAFDPAQTRERPFWTAEGPQPAQMMHRQGRMRLLENEEVQVLSLPYAADGERGERLSMLVFLPRTRGGLAALEETLTPAQLLGWIDALFKAPMHTVNLALPRFRMETRFDLAGTFAEMGMPRAFARGRADFSAILGSPGEVWIDQIVHKAFVEVNESGTEAAAATAVAMVRMTAVLDEPPPRNFHADHPFLFAIRDNHTRTLLFLGRMNTP